MGMVEEEPARGSTLDRVDQVGHDRARHLRGEAAGVAKQDGADTFARCHGIAKIRCGDPEGSASLGTHDRLVRPTIVAEQQRPTDEALLAGQRHRQPLPGVQDVDEADHARFGKAEILDRVARSGQDRAGFERHLLETWCEKTKGRPVRERIVCVLPQDLCWEIAEVHVGDPDRNHELRVAELATHNVAEGEFLLYALLPDVLGNDNNLLDRLMPQHVLNFVPKIVAAPKRANVDPDLVPGRG